MSDLSPPNNWRTRALLAGGILGSLVGIGAAYLYVRTVEENPEGDPPELPATRDAMRIGIALVALVRQIADLGARR